MLSNESREGYARLPEDLLRDLLAGAGEVVEEVASLLAPVLDSRDRLRSVLLDLGLIRTFKNMSPCSIAGIDGGFAVERTSAIDLSLAVGVGVEGLGSTTIWDSTQYEWWTNVARHNVDAERLARGVMVASEIAILEVAPHSLRILDGSHLTLVIQLNSALSSESPDIRSEARRVWKRLGTEKGLAEVCSNPDIIAMPKYDSSNTIADRLEAQLGISLPGDDKYLMGLLLEPGELLVPQQVPKHPWQTLHFNAGSSADEDLEQSFTDAILPLKERRLMFTYFKPDRLSPAFRLEIKPVVQEPDLDILCSTLSSQITGPFVREPYPQYLSDVMAKSVGLGLSALQTAVQLGLSGMGRPELSEVLIRSYRTEGV
ncbi:MAG: hypothetical protein OXE05_02505 [Chloroflexi bacterium]|nr:hypothetical protein [Chloroflexota bacterium]